MSASDRFHPSLLLPRVEHVKGTSQARHASGGILLDTDLACTNDAEAVYHEERRQRDYRILRAAYSSLSAAMLASAVRDAPQVLGWGAMTTV